MDMFPHTVTVYNVEMQEGEGLAERTVNHIAVLRGVLLDETRGAKVSESGLEGADAVSLYIPASVRAADGVTGALRQYVSPAAFRRAADKTHLWTLSVGRDCFFVKGETVLPDLDVQAIETAADGVYDVSRVDYKDFGGDMRHWEVGGV